jgi:hypothetical protein
MYQTVRTRTPNISFHTSQDLNKTHVAVGTNDTMFGLQVGPATMISSTARAAYSRWSGWIISKTNAISMVVFTGSSPQIRQSSADQVT